MIRALAPYVAAIALVAAIAGGVWVMSLRADVARLEAENASLARSVATLEGARDQARLAADVARAEADRQQRKAEEYDRLRETLLKGENDAPLPDWFRDYLDALLGGGVVRSAD